MYMNKNQMYKVYNTKIIEYKKIILNIIQLIVFIRVQLGIYKIYRNQNYYQIHAEINANNINNK